MMFFCLPVQLFLWFVLALGPVYEGRVEVSGWRPRGSMYGWIYKARMTQ